MVLNLRTLQLEIAAVKECGERNFVVLNLDGDCKFTDDLLHPITDVPEQAKYTQLKQNLIELHKIKKKETKWTCTFENCRSSYDNAGSFWKHK